MLYLVPDMYGPPGGIAHYCRLVGRAAMTSGHDVHAIALRDQPPPTMPSLTSYVACNGSRPRFVLRVTQAMLRHRFDMVIAGHINLAPIAHWVARLQRIPLVTFLYGIDAWMLLSPARLSALRASTQLIAISAYTADRSATYHHLDRSRIAVLHNCLSPDFVFPLARPTHPTSPTLLTVARMSLAEQYKGHDETLHAVARLIHEFPTLRYHIVGDGDGRPRLESLAQELGIAEVVRFHGSLSDADLIEQYRRADLFVMPSRFEGFGFVFLEAMAAALSVVAGNQDATVEVVEDGKTGLLVDPTSPDAITGAVRTLLADAQLRERMGRAGQDRVAERFNFSTFQQRLGSLLARAMS